MKRIILIGLCILSLSMTSCVPRFYIMEPDNTKEHIAWTAGSLGLIWWGASVMERSEGEMIEYTTGFGIAAIGTTGLYMTIFEF